MTHARSHCPYTEQAVGWALHALEPAEEMALQMHVPQCSECRAAVRDTESVLTRFGAAVEQVDPPHELRSSILSAAAETPQVRSTSRVEPATTPVPVSRHLTPSPSARTVATPPVGNSRPPRIGRTLRRRLVAVTAAVLAVVSIGGLGVRAAELQTERDAVTARAQNLAELVQQLNKPHAVLAADNGAAVAAVVLADGRREVYTVGLPANTTDRTYVLWGVKGAAPQPLGAFDVASADRGLRSVGASGQDAYEAYAISLEPGRTPPATPTDVVASGKLVA